MNENVPLVRQTPRENILVAIENAKEEEKRQKQKEKEARILRKKEREETIVIKYREAMKEIFIESYFHLAGTYFKLSREKIAVLPHEEAIELKNLIKRRAQWRVWIRFTSVITLLPVVGLFAVCVRRFLVDPVYEFNSYSWEGLFLRSSSFLGNQCEKEYVDCIAENIRPSHQKLQTLIAHIRLLRGHGHLAGD